MSSRPHSTKYLAGMLALLLTTSSCARFTSGISDAELLRDLPADAVIQTLDDYRADPSHTGKVLLVNVWATWCAPCIKEFPYLVDLQRTYSDRLHVVFIATDFPEQREESLDFLREQGVDWTTWFKTGSDQTFIESLSETWTGAIPFTKFVSSDGQTLAEWTDEADYDTFERAALKAFAQNAER